MDAPGSEVVRLTTDAGIEAVYKVPKKDTRAYAHHLEMRNAVALAKSMKERLIFGLAHETWSNTRIKKEDGSILLEYHDPDPFDPKPHKVPPGTFPEYPVAGGP